MLSLVFKLLKPTVIDFEAVTLDASKESHVEFRISKSHQLIDKFTVGGKALSMLYTKAHVLSKMYTNFKIKHYYAIKFLNKQTNKTESIEYALGENFSNVCVFQMFLYQISLSLYCISKCFHSSTLCVSICVTNFLNAIDSCCLFLRFAIIFKVCN